MKHPEPVAPTPVRLYETADGRVVPEGDPDASRLYAAEGRKVPVAVLEAVLPAKEAKQLRAETADEPKAVSFGGSDSGDEGEPKKRRLGRRKKSGD